MKNKAVLKNLNILLGAVEWCGCDITSAWVVGSGELPEIHLNEKNFRELFSGEPCDHETNYFPSDTHPDRVSTVLEGVLYFSMFPSATNKDSKKTTVVLNHIEV